jgi:hypothetical protein
MRDPRTHAQLAWLALLGLVPLCACPQVTDRHLFAVLPEPTPASDDDSSDDDSAPDDDDSTVAPCDDSFLVGHDEAVSLQSDLAPLFASRCQPCHTGQDQGDLTLTAPMARAELVDVANNLGYGDEMPRVTAGDPQQSYILHKLMQCDREDARWGYLQSPMPPQIGGNEPLSHEELNLIYTWILQGAQDN